MGRYGELFQPEKRPTSLGIDASHGTACSAGERGRRCTWASGLREQCVRAWCVVEGEGEPEGGREREREREREGEREGEREREREGQRPCG